MAGKEFFVDMPHSKVADLLSKHLSPQRFYHHNEIGGDNWRVCRVARLPRGIATPRANGGKTKITLIDEADASIISFILLKA